jgi:hypothetical protein
MQNARFISAFGYAKNTRNKAVMLAEIAGLGLAGCGDTPIEQALLGAGAGVGVATVAGTGLAGGALIGATANLVYCQKYPSKC